MPLNWCPTDYEAAQPGNGAGHLHVGTEPRVYTVIWTALTPSDMGITRGTYSSSVGVSGPAPTLPTEPEADSGTSSDTFVALGQGAVIVLGVLAFVLLRSRAR